MDKKESRDREKKKCGKTKNADTNGGRTNRKEIQSEAPIISRRIGVCGGAKQPDLPKISKELLPQREEANGRTSTMVPHEEKEPLSAEAERQDGRPNHGHAEFSGLSENVPISLRGNKELLEENAELLRKKNELEVLLQKAQVLLEKNGLPAINQEEKGDIMIAGNSCDVAIKSQDNFGKMNNITTNVANGSEEPENRSLVDSENRSLVEILNEKADEITVNAKLCLEVLHEDKYSGSKETQSDLEKRQLSLQKSELDADNDSGSRETQSDLENSELPLQKSEPHEDKDSGSKETQSDLENSELPLQKSELQEDKDSGSKETQSDLENSELPLQKFELQEDKNSGSKETQSDLEKPQIPVQKSKLTSAKTYALSSECTVQKTNPVEEKALQEEGKESLTVLSESAKCTEENQESKIEEVDDNEQFDEKLELQRLLQKAKLLLEKANRPVSTESGTEKVDEYLKETAESKEPSRQKTDNAFDAQKVFNSDQKEENKTNRPFEVATARNEMPLEMTKELRLEKTEVEKQLQNSGTDELTSAEVKGSAKHNAPGVSETVAADRNSWSDIQKALFWEKNELSLLLLKTQLLQQKADLIKSHNQLPMGKIDPEENSLAPLPKATELSSQATKELLQTEQMSPEITKPETTEATVDKIKQMSDATLTSSETSKEVLDTTHKSSETTKAVSETILSSETTKPNTEITQVSSEKTKPTLDTTQIFSEKNKPQLETNEKSSEQSMPPLDKNARPLQTTSHEVTKENVKSSAEEQFKNREEIPQENMTQEENLPTNEAYTKYISEIKCENSDPNPPGLKTEVILKEVDPKTMDPLLNNEATKEENQSHNEDVESSDEDDPSFDAKHELGLLLQRAKLVIEKAKVTVLQRQLLTESVLGPPAETLQPSELEKESPVFEMVTGKPIKSSTERNEETYLKEQLQNSEAMKTQISQDAQLEFLLEKTKQLKQKADELLNQMNVSEIESDQQSANTKLPNQENNIVSSRESYATLSVGKIKEEKTNNVEPAKQPTELNLDKTIAEQNLEADTTVPPKEIEKFALPVNEEQNLEAGTTVPAKQIEESSLPVNEKQTSEAGTLVPGTIVPAKQFEEPALPVNEDSQLELEEIEESQLEIEEIEKSQFEIEDEYLSDDSEMSDIIMYYEGADSSYEEDENLPEENDSLSNEQDLQQSQQPTEFAGEKYPCDEKKELQILLERTKLLLEEAKLPLPSIKTLPDENNLPSMKETVSESVEMPVKAEKTRKDQNLSLQSPEPVFAKIEMPLRKTETVTETTDMPSQKSETTIKTTEMPSEKTEIVTKTTEMPSEKTEIVTKTTAMPSEKTEIVTKTAEMPSEKCETTIKTTEMPSQKTEIVTKTTEMPSEKCETTIKTTEMPSEKTEIVKKTTEMPPEKSETVINATEIPSETVLLAKEMTSEKSIAALEANESPSEKSYSSITSTDEAFLAETVSDSKHLNKNTQAEANHAAHMIQEKIFEEMTSSELLQNLMQLKTEVASLLESNLHAKTENSSKAKNSLQDKTSEGNAENNVSLTTQESEKPHPDHSNSMVIPKHTEHGTSVEQGSQPQDEATAGVQVSQMEAQNTADGNIEIFKGWTPMTNYTLLLKLQSEMAKMQLQLSSLQDAMRATNSVVQELMEAAFSEM